MSEQIYSAGNSKVRYCQNCLKSPVKTTSDRAVFTSSQEFFLHLRQYHCAKEGGSFVCLYGSNSVCPSLPIDGVSEVDYRDHVWKDHLSLNNFNRSELSPSSMLSQANCPIDEKSSSGPSVVQGQHKWTVYMSQVNLPAVLNDPRLAKRETDFFTKTWGESFERSTIYPSQYIPCITHDDFQKFLLKMSSRRRHLKKAINAPQTKRHSESLTKMEDFDAIPKIFFSSNFSLLDAETFYKVLPWSCIEKPQGNNKQQSSKLLQEKLSHYLDLVEVQITKQISAKSDSFFEAMVYQNTLQDHLQKTCNTVHFLREKVTKLDDILASQPLQVIHQSSLRFKYKQIHEKLKFMVTVQQTQPMIQLLLSTNDFLGALDLISTTQEVLSQELAGIQCFRHLGCQLNEMEKLIVRMVEDEFVIFISNFFNQPLNQINSHFQKPLSSPEVSLSDKYSNIDQERLVLIVLGLYRLDRSDFLESLENESCLTVRTVIKKVAVEAVAMSETVETDRLASQLRLLNFEQWLNLLKKIFVCLVIILQRVQKVANIFQFTAKKLVDRNDIPTNTAPIKDLKGFDKSSSTEMLCEPTVSNTIIESSLISSTTTTKHSLQQSIFNDNLFNNDPQVVTDFGAGGEREAGSDPLIILRKSSIHSSNVLPYDGQKDGIVIGAEGTSREVTNTEVFKTSSTSEIQTEEWKEHVSEILKDCDPLLSEGKSLKIIGALNEHLCRVCEHAHDRCYKFSTIRAKDGFLDRLSMTEFFELSQHIEWFVLHTERICGRKSSLLRGSLLNQANKFVKKFHEERKNKLCLILDHERWKQADVPSEFQDLVNHISETGHLSLPTKKLDSGRSHEFLYVDGEKYAVVGTALILLKLVVEYCEFAEKLPLVAPEILNRLVELLKTFNSRTCQLILGAGALHLVGLKTISTRNLGLASRCLELMLSFFPLVKSHFHSRLHSKQLNMIKHFEHLYKDYRDHVAEISVKLVSIMDTVLQGILNKYEIKSGPSQTFEVLLKQTTRFHEAISDLLPVEQVQSILIQFHLNFGRSFKRQLNALGFSRDSINQLNCVESDLKCYVSGIQALSGLKDFSLNLSDIIL